MNRSSPGLLISKSIDGFLIFRTAEGLSQRTIASYEATLNRWICYTGDPDVSIVSSSDLTGYTGWLRTEYRPVRGGWPARDRFVSYRKGRVVPGSAPRGIGLDQPGQGVSIQLVAPDYGESFLGEEGLSVLLEAGHRREGRGGKGCTVCLGKVARKVLRCFSFNMERGYLTLL